MDWFNRNKGVLIAWLIIGTWAILLIALLRLDLDYLSPLTYVLVLVQMHLYTGLFITGHDAMHGTVSRNKKLNKITGIIAIGLFAYNSYWRLLPKHHQHHKFVGTEDDPDFHPGFFLRWYFNFLKQYVTIWQILLMAITYNILIQFFPAENVVLYWIVPSLLSTLQLFYFGTYLPHKGEHASENIHKSATLGKNHVVAFFTCYFFGYHYEHHDTPHVPWWQLYKQKV